VFISYSHDSPEHRQRVLALSERLRHDGIDADLDQYVEGSPPEKWPRWMLDRLDWADFVLLICTPTYYRRFRGHEAPGIGKGVDWEGAIITDAIYEARSKTLKFVPLLFDPADAQSIPEPVRGYSVYCLSSADEYRALYDFLLGQAGIEPRPLGVRRTKARECAEPMTFPSDETESTEEGAATPSRLWPDSPSRSGTTAATECYARLRTLCSCGETPDAQTRRELWQAVKKDRPASFLAWQLATLARWGTPEYLEVDEHFTPLQVQVRVRERDEDPSERQLRPCDTLAEAMAAVFDEHEAPASVLFAPPGGGKSTLLRHYQLQQARRLDDSERLVFYVQLREYRPENLPPDDRASELPALAWLEAEWRNESGQAPPLAAFLRQGTLTLLLDGLNEIPRDSDEAYRERVGEWRALVDAVDRDYPGVRLLFACRPLDYSQRLDAGRHTRLPEIEVQPMEPERIRAFIDKRFDPATAEQLWSQLEAGSALALYSSPFTLNLLLGQIDTDGEAIQIPQDRAALFSGLVRARLRRECHKGNPRFAGPALLDERDRTVLLTGKPRPHWLPDGTAFFEALAALAFQIQDASGSHERWGSLRWRKARKAVAAVLEEAQDPDDALHAACDLGLFEDESSQANDVRFVHQQIQEYFAAWVLAEHPDPEKLALPWKGADLVRSTETLLAEGGDDDLPELPTTGWEESALMAASLCDHPDAFVWGLIPANLALAGRCAAAAGAAISGDLREDLRRRLIARIQDSEADLRARIAAGRALGELGDPRLREPPIQARVRPLLPAFAAIPGGTYRIGGDPDGFDTERPARELTLAGFELALHPVTNAEYARFIEAGGYREDAYWPGRALAWRKGEIGQEATQGRLREIRQIILDDLGPEATAEAIRDRHSLSLAQARIWQERASETDDVFEVWLQKTYPPPSAPFTQPAYWRSPILGNPAQPVVGICWYEARAYCLWLSDLLDTHAYRLPSEAEWEAAGRGQGQWRRFAWPGDFDPLHANTAETRLGVTTPVGVFPANKTPDSGLLDLCGNVWEWTATPWTQSEHWAPASGAADGEPDARRVVRGGSWDYSVSFARLGSRSGSVPGYRLGDLGFRLCRASHISTGLLMVICVNRGPRARGIARSRPASNR